MLFRIITIALILGLAAIILGIAYYYKKLSLDTKIKEAEEHSQQLVEKAKKDALGIQTKAQKDAQDIIDRLRKSTEEEIKQRRQFVDQTEGRLIQREKHLDERDTHISEKEKQVEAGLEDIKEQHKQVAEQLQGLAIQLQNIAQLTVEEAKNLLISIVEKQARQQAGKMIKNIQEQAQKVANRKAKEIVTNAIQRSAIDYVSDATTSVVHLPDDELKGRIIGREGRNIRVFEAITGVDVIIDDTPGAVVLSCFNPIRREIAKIALEKLISDGRIHPSRVEEMVDRAEAELQEVIIERGEQAAETVVLQFHPKIIELLGKLHYRTSYGQNMLQHAIECATVAGIMAEELGVNVNLAKRGAMLHDIGKALDFEHGGSHTHLGRDICKKYGEHEVVINCIMSHHEEEEPDTIEAIIACTADAISSSRPGARRESLESYIKRLDKLEGVAKSFDGIDRAYAIQAGREIRVMVKPEVVDDPSAHKLALDIATKIESELEYPGEIKVSIIRETRASGVAR